MYEATCRAWHHAIDLTREMHTVVRCTAKERLCRLCIPPGLISKSLMYIYKLKKKDGEYGLMNLKCFLSYPYLWFLVFKKLITSNYRFIIAAFCSPVPVPSNGAVQGYRYELGATLRITCKQGYNLVPPDSSFRTCISDGSGGGKWSGKDPTCVCKC